MKGTMHIQGLYRSASSEVLLGQWGNQEISITKQNPVFLLQLYAVQNSVFAVIFFQFHLY